MTELSKSDLDSSYLNQDEERFEREVDKLGSRALANIRLGINTDSGEEAMPQAARPISKKPRRYSSRGGRSFRDPSDSDLDPHGQVTGEKLDSRQVELNTQGLMSAREALEQAKKPPVDAPHDPEEMRRKARESWNM